MEGWKTEMRCEVSQDRNHKTCLIDGDRLYVAPVWSPVSTVFNKRLGPQGW
jgi:hypothetical protein